MAPYTVEETTVYKMKEKLMSLSGDTFTVKDADDNEAFIIDGTALSIREKKILSDIDGNPLYQINEELVNFSLREKQYICDPESGEKLFTLRQAGVIFDRNTVNVFAGDDDDGNPVYTIAGGFLEKEFDIKDANTNEILGEIDRKRFENILTDKDTYAISVEAGQDAALIIAFAVAVDEIFRDD